MPGTAVELVARKERCLLSATRLPLHLIRRRAGVHLDRGPETYTIPATST
jgi:hypothetical protein